MAFIKQKGPGFLLCLCIAVPCWLLGKAFPVVGGPIFSIIAGMVITMFLKDKTKLEAGIKFASKRILTTAVVLLGFGLNLRVILQTGKQSLPIIICTICTSLVLALILRKVMHIEGRICALIGVGSSICGGSAIAATAPVVGADDEQVAQAMSVIFFFNVIAAILFPILGAAIGFDTTTGEGFGIFAGTAINDTSSVTAAAATWDSTWGLGSETLDKAVTVKLTRTLAIIPITIILALMMTARAKKTGGEGTSVNVWKVFPKFIILFVLASVATTICVSLGVSSDFFDPLKELSKFFIVLAMAGIGLNSNVIKLVKSGGKPLILGAICWIGITLVSLLMQHMMHLW